MKNIKTHTSLIILIFLLTNQLIYSQINENSSAGMYSYTHEDDSMSVALNPEGEIPNMFIQNLKVPGDTLGSLPLDITKISSLNKIYVYAQNQIIDINASTNNVEDVINLQHSIYYPSIDDFLAQKAGSEKHLAYNNNAGLLYCSTEKMNIIEINPADNSWAEIVTRPSSLTQQWYRYQNLKYDSRKNRIYWAVSKINGSSIFIYDAQTYNLIHQIDLNGTLEDLEINDTKNEFYVSFAKEYRIYNDDNYSYTVIGNGNYQAGDLLYIHNDNIHKLFCFTRTYMHNPTLIYVVDFNNSNNITSFNSPLPTETAVYYSSVDNKIYAGFSPYSHTQNDLYIIDPVNYSIVNSLSTKSFSSLYENFPQSINELGNNIIVTKNHEICAFDKTTLNLQLLKKGINNVFFRSVICNDKDFVIGSWTGTVDVLNTGLSITNTINIGEPLFFGCYNNNGHKAYFYHQHFQDNSKVYILNTLTNQIKYVEIGSNITDVIYDEIRDKVYVSTYNDENTIKVIDGNTDLLLPQTQWIQLSHAYCGKMFLAPNDKLYCIVGMDNNNGAGIEIRNASNNYSLLKYQTVNITGALNGEFCYNPKNGNVYSTLRDINTYSTFGKFLEIDGNTDNITDYNVSAYPYKLVCNYYDNKVYFEYLPDDIHYLSVFRCDDHTFGQIQIGYQVRALEYAPDRNTLYILYYENRNSRIGIINDETLEEGPTVPATAISLKYNPNNFNIYVYVPYNGNKQYEGEVWEFEYDDPDNDGSGTFFNTGYVSLLNKNMNRVLGTLLNNDMLIDLDNNKLYVANGGFSNISVLQCPSDKDMFVNGENWISFPRLQRQNNDPVNTQSVLQNMDPLPISLSLEGREDNSDNPKRAYKNGNTWNTQDLPTVQSTRGYILTIPETPTDNYTLPYSGTRLNPSTQITLYQGHKNWVGYFLLEQQDPFDALSNVLPNLKTIKGQYWAAANMGTPSDPDWILTKPYPLHYGDMLILEPFTTTTFTWHTYGNPGNNLTFEDTQHYSYTPSGEYTPVFIEIDTSDRPLEIGAFVNDSCIGATRVNADDTLVLLRSYAPENTGDSIVFEKYYGNKSTDKKIVKSYYVYNTKFKINEKRCIKTNENKDFYLISFKNDKHSGKKSLDNKIVVNIFPNPVSKTLNLHYTIPKSTHFTVELYNGNGQLLNVFVDKALRIKGIYNERWTLNNNVKHGVYIIKISTDSQIVYKKIVVN